MISTHDFLKIINTNKLQIDEHCAKEILTLLRLQYKTYKKNIPPDNNNPENQRKYYHPDAKEDPHNLWAFKCKISGANSGQLKGKKISLKSNVFLASVPLEIGLPSTNKYIPSFDAPFVTQALNSGATILGKSNCEALCLSGGSHTCSNGLIHNPYKEGFTSGGSSSGCASLVARKIVDISIGSDQCGSTRVPASYCGVYGIKPTHGLIPYVGLTGIDSSIDHVGIITHKVHDSLLLLNSLSHLNITPLAKKNLHGIKIGVLKEGFSPNAISLEVNKRVLATVDELAKMGAKIETVSVPNHKKSWEMVLPIITESHMIDKIILSILKNYNDFGISNFNGLPEALQIFTLLKLTLNNYLPNRTLNNTFIFTQNILKQFNNLFNECDLILMPTSPILPQELPNDSSTFTQKFMKSVNMLSNTVSFNLTHHPAMSLPCAFSASGLPIGLMLVAKHYNEGIIYHVAEYLEKNFNWRNF